jgi:hypothetical protein
MNTKKGNRKLNLVRETVAPMNREQLADVNGGAHSVSIGFSNGRSVGISYSGWSVGVSVGDSVGISASY